MATERLSMRKTTEVLRREWARLRPHRAVAKRVGVSAGVVGSELARARAAGLASWAELEALDETSLEAALYRVSGSHGEASMHRERPASDCAWIQRERGRVGVTLQLLHDEYRQEHPEVYGYTALCERYREWLA